MSLMILFFIFLVTLAISFMQIDEADTKACLVFVIPAIIHEAICIKISGWLYYSSDILFNLLSVWFLVSFCYTNLSKKLEIALLLCIFLNFYGFYLWVNYSPPVMFNHLSKLFYIWVITIMYGDGEFVGIYKNIGEYSVVSGGNFNRFFFYNKAKQWKDKAQ